MGISFDMVYKESLTFSFMYVYGINQEVDSFNEMQLKINGIVSFGIVNIISGS